MKFEDFEFGASWIVYSETHIDGRGDFRETIRRDKFLTFTGLDFQIAQINCSTSKFGVLRGIHYSIAKEGQAKWVTCLKGRIRDYVVDLRRDSATFGKWSYIDISADSGVSVVMQTGMGHAFEALTEECIVSYALTSPYDPASEMTVSPFDSQLSIEWYFNIPNISDRDKNAPTLEEQAARGLLPGGSLSL